MAAWGDWTSYVVAASLRVSPKRWRRRLHGLSGPGFESHMEALLPHSVDCKGAQLQGEEVWTPHLAGAML